jgi:hypothetical protein
MKNRRSEGMALAMAPLALLLESSGHIDMMEDMAIFRMNAFGAETMLLLHRSDLSPLALPWGTK